MDIAGARILIVDDDAASRRLLDVRLRALGYDTIMAADGQDALIRQLAQKTAWLEQEVLNLRGRA